MEDSNMIIGLSGVLVGVFLATIAIIWQIRSQSSRVDAMGDRLSAEIRAQGAELTETRLEQARLEGANRMQSDRTDRIEGLSETLSAELRSQSESLTETRLEQARLEGANRILRRQSHTHPPHNPPIDQEAAAD